MTSAIRSEVRASDALDHARLPPLFRWPGGKRWLVPRLREMMRPMTGRYVEPFLGGGALFFATAPDRSRVSDANADLMACYSAIRDAPDAVAAVLADWPRNAETYYAVRATTPREQVSRAARFIYLTNLAFNGIYRVNRQGQFNVPYSGRAYIPMSSADELRRYSEVLARAEILAGDFEDALADVGVGDLVYIDPPYTVAHSNNGFVKYNDRIFSWKDQQRLATRAARLDRAGAVVLISNAYHPSIRDLYPTFRAVVVDRSSVMAAATPFRGPIQEYVFTNVE